MASDVEDRSLGAFLIEGEVDGRRLHLGYQDGALTGDEGAMAALRSLAAIREGEPVGWDFATFTSNAHLRDARSALVITLQMPWDWWRFIERPTGAAILPDRGQSGTASSSTPNSPRPPADAEG